MQADIRQLYEIFFAVDEIEQDLFRDILQCIYVHTAVFFDAFKCAEYFLNGINAGIFLYDVIWWHQLKAGVLGGDTDGRYANFLQGTNVAFGNGLPFYQITATVIIENALGKD